MLIKDYLDQKPRISEKAKIFENACIVGDVWIKDDVSVWFNATIRGDMAEVVIQEGTNIQDNAVIHTNFSTPTYIGKNVTVGHGAIIHGATIHDDCLIGMGSIILDKAVIMEECLIGAGALIPPGKVIPKRSLVVGNPMRIVRELTEEEIKANQTNSLNYVKLMNEF